MGKLSRILVSFIVLLILLSLSTFTVDQREFALVFRLGEIVSVKKDPGLYFKTPIVENVRFFDKRILTYESEQPDRFITSEKKKRIGGFIHKMENHRSIKVLCIS